MMRPKSSTWMYEHTFITSDTSCSTSRIAVPSRAEVHQQLAELVGLLLVLAGRRLVEQQDLRPGHQRPTHLDPARHAGGNLGDVAIGEVGEAEQLEHALALRAAHRGDRHGPSGCGSRRQPDVLAHRSAT